MIFKQLPTIISDLNKLGIALKSLDALNLRFVGVDAGNVQVYQSAIKGLSAEQAAFALATKGANAAQIEEIMTTETATLVKGTYTQADIQAALAKNGLASSATILTTAQQKEIVQSGLITSEKLAEVAVTLGLTTAEYDSLITKKALNVEMVKQQLESMGVVGAAQKQILVMLGLTTAEGGAITGTNVLTASFAKLWAVISAHPIGAIITAVGALAVGIVAATNAANNAKEEARQTAIELTNAYNQEKSSLDSQIDKYKELKETLDNGNLSTDKARSIKEQLLEIQKSLIESYGNEVSNIDLVNGKYKEQLGLLSELSKEKASDYVKENRAAFEDAKEELEKTRTYKIGSIFSYNSRNGMSDEQKELYEYIKSYSDLFEIRSMHDTSTFSNSDYAPTLFVNANADEAKAIIDQFYDDIETYIKDNNLQLDYNSLQIGLSKVSSDIETDNALKEYREIYDEFIKAEIVRNDTLRPLYQQSIQAVEDYNNALSTGEGVEEAKTNLDSVQQSVQNATGELEGSQDVFDGIYDGINKDAEAAYNLGQAFENDKTVQEYAEQLRGLSDIDLKAINFEDNVQSPGEDAFGALIDILGLSENEVQSLIDKLVELGYVQGEVQSSASNKPDILSYETLSESADSASDAVSTLRSSISTLNDAFAEQEANGSISVDTMLSLVEAGYATALSFDKETGACQINTNAMLELAKAKLQVQIADLESLKINIANKLKDEGLAANEAANGYLNLAKAKLTAEQSTAVSEYNNASAQIMALQNVIDNLDSVSVGNYSSKYTSSSSSSTDPLKDAFTQEYNTLKHNLEMEYITEKQYYDSLAVLNKKYFAGKSEYLDEYRQYEEEVYKGLKSYYKDYIDSQIDLLESQLDAGIINYAHYSSTVKSLLDNMYADSKISAEDYHNYIKQMLEKQIDIYDKVLSAVTRRFDSEIDKINEIIDGIEKQNDLLEEQISDMESAANAVVNYYDSLIDANQESIDGLEKKNDTIQEQIDKYESLISVADRLYEEQQNALKEQQDAIQDSIDALNDENSALDLQYRKEQALYNLNRAKTQRTRKVFNGTEFVYETDQSEIREAQKELQDIKTEELINSLEKEKDALQESIDALQKYRDTLSEISDSYNQLIDERNAIELLGETYKDQILGTNIEDWEYLKNRYISANQEMADNTNLIDSLNEKIEIWSDEKEQWSSLTQSIKNEADRQKAIEQFGADFEVKINEGRFNAYDDFKNKYLNIQSQINDNTQLIDSYNEKVEYYESLKDQWKSITDIHENELSDQYAAQLLGASWESDILSGRLDTLTNFKNKYVSLQQELADATVAANNAIVASNLAAQQNQTSSNTSVGNSNTSSGGSNSANTSTTNVSWAVLNASSKGMIRAGFSNAGDAVSWATSNGYTVASVDTTNHAVFVNVKKAANHKYASGTTNAKKGINLVGEDGTETYIDNDGKASLVTEPTLIPMEGGETVMNARETKSLFDPSNFVPVDTLSFTGIDGKIVRFNQEELWQKMQSAMPSFSSMIRPNIQMPKYDATPAQNNTTPVVQHITLTLPNVTNDSGYERIRKELKQMQIDAYQFAHKR